MDTLATSAKDEEIRGRPFLSSLIHRLSSSEDNKPGAMVHILQPLLLSFPLESLPPFEPHHRVARVSANIFEPQGMNETPLKYTAGMVLAVPVDCELHHIKDTANVRIAIKTPDQKVQRRDRFQQRLGYLK